MGFLRTTAVVVALLAIHLGWAEYTTKQHFLGTCPRKGKDDPVMAGRAGRVLPPLIERLKEVTRLRKEKKLDDPEGGIERRIQHPRDLGCFNATLVVDTPNAANRVSFFSKQGKTFPVELRMSKNGFDGDGDPKVTGIALKVRGLPRGPRATKDKDPALRDEEDSFELALVGVDTLPLVATPEELVPFHEYLIWGGVPGVLWFLIRSHHPTLIFRLLPALLRGQSVTVPPYYEHFSVQASAFGDSAVRWQLAPCAPVTMPPAPANSKSFVAQLTEEELSRGDICMKLQVQRQVDPCTERVENVMSPWSTPFEQVARIVVSRGSKVRSDSHCENLSFNTWRAPAELKPLGWVARVRRLLYPVLAALRISHNRLAE
jgi:hypothetical protein